MVIKKFDLQFLPQRVSLKMLELTINHPNYRLDVNIMCILNQDLHCDFFSKTIPSKLSTVSIIGMHMHMHAAVDHNYSLSYSDVNITCCQGNYLAHAITLN